eukprot:scaffold53852_cov14-Tisochrysis_lutea.AAC.1
MEFLREGRAGSSQYDDLLGSDGASEAGLIQKANAPSVTLGKKSLNLSRVFNWLSSQKRAFSQDA